MNINEINDVLLEKVKNGDSEARDKIISLNIPYVGYILKRKIGGLKHQDIEDYMEIGIIGLIKAVDSYDPSKGVKFSTYSFKCIQNELMMEIRRNKKHKGTLSLDYMINNGEKDICSYLNNFADPEDINETIDDIISIKTIKKVIATKINTNQASVLNARYFTTQDVQSQLQVSQDLQMSQSYVSRLEQRGIKNLQHELCKAETNC